MNEFLMLFREPAPTDNGAPTPDAMQATMDKWNNWIGGIASQGKYVGGHPLERSGKVLRPAGMITDGPFAETKELLGGYIIVKADGLDEATTLAHGCPSLDVGGNVEVRQIRPM